MRNLILATAALMCGTSAWAQSTTTTSDQTTTTTQTTGDQTTTTTTEPSSTMSTTGTGQASMATTTTSADNQPAYGATTKIIAVGDQYTVHRVLPDGTVMVKTLTGEDAKMAMRGETPAALASFMATGNQMAANMPARSMTMGAGMASTMTTPTAEGTQAATGALASFDANKDGNLSPLEFAQSVIASSAPAAGGDTGLSAKARRDLRSRASGNGAVKLLNQTAGEFSAADANHDMRVDQNELAIWYSMGKPDAANRMSMTSGAGMSTTSTTGAGSTTSTDTTSTTGTSTPTTSATMNSTSPSGTTAPDDTTTPKDTGVTPTPSH